MQERFRNFALNVSSSGVKTILSALIGLVLTPIIIKNVGIEAFGLFKTLQDYVAYFMILEFGLYGALLAAFNRTVSVRNKEEGLQALSLGFFGYLKVAAIAFTLSLLFLPALTIVIKHDYLPDHSFYFSYLALILSFLASPLLAFRAYLDASQKGYQINISLMLQVVLNAIGIIVALYYQLGVPGLCTSLLISNGISSLYMFKACELSLKDIIAAKKDALKNSSLISGMKKMRKAMFLNDLSGKVCLFSDNIIIGYILGAKFVTPFFVTQKLSQIIQSQLQSLSNSSWAGLGEIYHQKNPEALGEGLIDLTKWIAVIAISTLVPVATYNSAFIANWTGLSTYGGNLVSLVACANAFFLGILTLWGWSFTATSKLDLLIPLNWTQTVINITLNIILTLKYGILGPILATLICYIVLNMTWMTILVKREFRANLIPLTFNWILPLTYGSIVVFLWTRFRGEVVTLGWVRLIAEMSLQGLMTLGLSFFLIMNRRERKSSFDRLMKLLRIRK